MGGAGIWGVDTAARVCWWPWAGNKGGSFFLRLRLVCVGDGLKRDFSESRGCSLAQLLRRAE